MITFDLERIVWEIIIFSCMSRESNRWARDIRQLVEVVSTTLHLPVQLHCCCTFGTQRIGPDLSLFCFLTCPPFASHYHPATTLHSSLHFRSPRLWHSRAISHIWQASPSHPICHQWHHLWESARPYRIFFLSSFSHIMTWPASKLGKIKLGLKIQD